MKEHKKLYQKLVSKVTLHFVWCHLSRKQIQHGRYLETWYLEAGRDLGTTEADTEVGVL